MRELSESIGDWRSQLESSSFIRSRKGDSIGGTQMDVFTRPGIDVVVKVPKGHPIFLENTIAAYEQAPESIVPLVRELRI